MSNPDYQSYQKSLVPSWLQNPERPTAMKGLLPYARCHADIVWSTLAWLVHRRERPTKGHGFDGVIRALGTAQQPSFAREWWNGGLPPLLNVALISFNEALLRKGLEFRIPEFVRAADCVLALTRKEGRTAFAQKALRIAPEIAQSPVLAGMDVNAFLIELYARRSDCVHGRIPFDDLTAQGEAGTDRAARLEYVSEHVARSAVITHSQR